MTRFSDAALLKGDFATMLKKAPKQEDWDKQTECENPAESVSQEVAKQLFQLNTQIDNEKERLVVTTYSAHGPVTVVSIMPTEGYLVRIDGVMPDGNPVAMVQHVNQLSVSITKAPLVSEKSAAKDMDDDGLDIGFVIFDELKKRTEKRAKPKRKAAAKRKTQTKKK